MLSIHEIEKYYPEHLQKFKRFILREYLQYKILEVIFSGPHANKLVFLGGTCLRLIHGNNRFSEDLDFDNFNLSESEFFDISQNIERKLEKYGYGIEIKLISRGAYHCYIRFPKLLFEQGLSGYEEEKILIQLDTEPHHYDFSPELPFLNRFDVFTRVPSCPLSLLMAQKCYAIVNRPRNKGRDFYDLVFLIGRGVKPDMRYLKQKLNIQSSHDLQSMLLDKCRSLDMKEMAKDVAPFLFNPSDEKMVALFPEYIASNPNAFA